MSCRQPQQFWPCAMIPVSLWCDFFFVPFVTHVCNVGTFNTLFYISDLVLNDHFDSPI